MKVLILILGLSAGPLFGVEGACTIDVQKFCGEAKTGTSEVTKCLEDHVHELSPDCKNKQVAGKEKLKPLQKSAPKSGKKGIGKGDNKNDGN